MAAVLLEQWGLLEGGDHVHTSTLLGCFIFYARICVISTVVGLARKYARESLQGSNIGWTCQSGISQGRGVGIPSLCQPSNPPMALRKDLSAAALPNPQAADSADRFSDISKSHLSFKGRRRGHCGVYESGIKRKCWLCHPPICLDLSAVY